MYIRIYLYIMYIYTDAGRPRAMKSCHVSGLGIVTDDPCSAIQAAIRSVSVVSALAAMSGVPYHACQARFKTVSTILCVSASDVVLSMSAILVCPVAHDVPHLKPCHVLFLLPCSDLVWTRPRPPFIFNRSAHSAGPL